jgi:hypothetical protein
MLHKLLILLVLFPITNFSQNKFTSSKYNYSFIIPDGWYVKDKIYNPDVDAKIVDGKGNSFIVTVIPNPAPEFKTASQMMKGLTNQELKEQFDGLHGETRIIKRGVIYLDGVEFYYIFIYTPFEGRLKLLHKQYAAIYKNKIISIDACAIETFTDETTPVFALMLNTFKFNKKNEISGLPFSKNSINKKQTSINIKI